MKTTISPEPALLGFLVAGPMHGYDLYRRVNHELAPIWHLGMSQMYAILKTYEREGWIGARLETQKTYPARKMLELTAAGRQAYHRWLRQPARGMREFRIDFFLRLYFTRQAGLIQSKVLIERQREALLRELTSLQNQRAVSSGEESDFQGLARDFRIHQLSMVLKWLDTHRDQLVQRDHPRAYASTQTTPRGSRRHHR